MSEEIVHIYVRGGVPGPRGKAGVGTDGTGGIGVGVPPISVDGDGNVSVAVGTTAGTVAAGDDSRIVNAVPNSRQIIAGSGLLGGGALSSNATLSADPEYIRDVVASLLVAGTNVTIVNNDGADTITISASGGGGGSGPGGLDVEQIEDLMSTFLVAGSNIGLTYNDALDTLTIAVTGLGSAAFQSASAFDVAGAAAAAQAASQPLDSDLTAIAALSTTSYGRSLLALSDAAAARTALALANSATLPVGTTAGTVAAGDDARLSDSRTPTAHASSHSASGSDPLLFPSGGRSDTYWKFSSTTTVADPGAGKFRLNAATRAAATTLVIDNITDGGTDISNFVPLLQSGDLVFVQDQNDATRYVRYQVTGAATNGTGYWTIPISVSLAPAGGEFINNNPCLLLWSLQAFNGGPSQPLDSDLTAIAALTTTSYGRAFLALADATAARTALSLGNAATLAVGTTTGTVAAGDDSRITGSVQKSTVTTKGDLIAATGSATVARHAVPSDAGIVIADSSQSDGWRNSYPPTLIQYSIGKTPLVVEADVFRWYNRTGRTMTIKRIWMSVGTAPTGSAIKGKITKNGTTIFTTGPETNAPTIAATAFVSSAVTNMDVTSIADGDYLTFELTQVGSTIAGGYLTFYVLVDG